MARIARSKEIVLTFDLEEYSVPMEFGEKIGPDFSASERALDYLLSACEKATYFTTIGFAKKFPGRIREIAKKGNEIALHGEIWQARQEKRALEKICKRKVVGFRAHMFRAKREEIAGLAKEGFLYDSSINKTVVPGRYSNFGRVPRKIGEIVELPITAPLGLPLSFVWFRIFPFGALKALSIVSGDSPQVHYFHPWEFSKVKAGRHPLAKLSAYGCGTEAFKEKFEKFFAWEEATRGARFSLACEAAASFSRAFR